MSNQPSIKRMFQAMAERVHADEPWREVLHDYGLSMQMGRWLGRDQTPDQAVSVAEHPAAQQVTRELEGEQA